MAASVKYKIRLGTVFLFLLLLLSSGVCIYYLVRLKNDARAILQDNYESLQYCHTMQGALDSIPVNAAAYLSRFQQALVQQEGNITEPGEAPATAQLRRYFEQLKAGDTSLAVQESIRLQLQTILALNMSAIQHKNHRAEARADQALMYISLIGTLVFLIALTFTYNFPSVVTGPIHQFTEAIQEVGRKNYSYRLHLNRKDEFGRLADAFNEMAERLEYFESSNLNKLLFEKARAEAVINSLKDASIGIDRKGVILFANDRALQLLGLEKKEIVGQPSEAISRHNDLFRYLVEESNSMPFKVVVEGKENYFVKEVVEVPGEDATSTVLVLKNITSFKELDAAKTNFIATVSHELKTPLASSDFSLKLLDDERVGKLSAEQKELIQHLKQDNQRMLRILSELLNLSQVEAGKMQLELKEVDPAILVENALATVAAAAAEREIVIQKQVDPNLPQLKLDAEKTTWVLNNFLTNAIKHAPEKSQVTIAVARQESQLVFSVADQGPGIAPEYLSKVFDRYFKVPGSKVKGTGLGLAISKEFIEAQGGTTWVESGLGRGSAFKFSFPLEKVATGLEIKKNSF